MVRTAVTVLAFLSGVAFAVPSIGKYGDIVWDGRIPVTMDVKDFDNAAKSPFNPDYVKGQSEFLVRNRCGIVTQSVMLS